METFCENQENLCTFETKFLNRQKKKEKVKRQERNLRRQTGSLQYSGCFCLVWLIIYP